VEGNGRSLIEALLKATEESREQCRGRNSYRALPEGETRVTPLLQSDWSIEGEASDVEVSCEQIE
jgi:hypothetical protein